MAESSKFTVAKLGDDNYQAWKFKIKMLLIREGTWKYTQERKPESASQEWITNDQKAQSTICLSIEDNQIVHICKATTAKEMWETLQKVDERISLSTKLYLLRKLYQLRLNKGQEMQDYIRDTLSLVERLRGMDQEILLFESSSVTAEWAPTRL